MNNEFYIGYLPEAPPKSKSLKRKTFWVLVVLAIGLGIVLATSQMGFPSGEYQYGKLTEISGVIYKTPVPMIKVLHGKDVAGKPVYQSVILVSFGKRGASRVLDKIEKKAGQPLEGGVTTLRGIWVFRDGKAMFELTEMENSFVNISPTWEGENGTINAKEIRPLRTRYGDVELSGEIIDPKCYLGAMKPGEGKPHRSCAILCIKGGIPPVLVTEGRQGEKGYFLLVGPKGQPINEQVLPFVADQVSIRGRLESLDDWLVLFLDPVDIRRI